MKSNDPLKMIHLNLPTARRALFGVFCLYAGLSATGCAASESNNWAQTSPMISPNERSEAVVDARKADEDEQTP